MMPIICICNAFSVLNVLCILCKSSMPDAFFIFFLFAAILQLQYQPDLRHRQNICFIINQNLLIDAIVPPDRALCKP